VIDFECLALSHSLAYPAEVDYVSDTYEQGGVRAGEGGTERRRATYLRTGNIRTGAGARGRGGGGSQEVCCFERDWINNISTVGPSSAPPHMKMTWSKCHEGLATL